MKPVEPISPKPSRTPARLRLFGEIVVIVGLLSAALIYIFAPEPDAVSIAMNERLYDYQVQRIGGQAGLLLVRFNNWFESLWRGERLAWTIGVLAIVAGLACFKLASLLEETPPASREDGDGI